MLGRLASAIPKYLELGWWGLVSPRLIERVPLVVYQAVVLRFLNNHAVGTVVVPNGLHFGVGVDAAELDERASAQQAVALQRLIGLVHRVPRQAERLRHLPTRRQPLSRRQPPRLHQLAQEPLELTVDGLPTRAIRLKRQLQHEPKLLDPIKA